MLCIRNVCIYMLKSRTRHTNTKRANNVSKPIQTFNKFNIFSELSNTATAKTKQPAVNDKPNVMHLDN